MFQLCVWLVDSNYESPNIQEGMLDSLFIILWSIILYRPQYKPSGFTMCLISMDMQSRKLVIKIIKCIVLANSQENLLHLGDLLTSISHHQYDLRMYTYLKKKKKNDSYVLCIALLSRITPWLISQSNSWFWSLRNGEYPLNLSLVYL